MLLHEAIWSMLFINNYSTLFAIKKYFSYTSDYKFLSHTWLLGVEIQFLLAAPFLFRFINSREKPLLWIIIGTLLSAMLHLLIGFDIILCRIWQFLIGSLAYYCSSSVVVDYIIIDKNQQQKKLLYFLSWMAAFIACFSNIPYNNKSFDIVSILRLLMTALAGLIIYLGSTFPITIPYYAEIILIYTGDLFYALYLIHWPVIMFFKYYGIFYSYWILFVIFIIIFLSIIFHELFVKQIVSFSWTHNGIMMAVLYAFIIASKIFSHPFPNPDVSVPLNTNSNTYNPITANEMESLSCDDLHYPCDEGIFDYITRNGKYKSYCAYNLNPTSNKTAVIFGNSFAYTQSKGILTAIKLAKNKFKKVYLVIGFSCNPLVGELDTNIKCLETNAANSKFLETLQPDIIIFSALIAHIKELQLPAPSPDDIAKHSNYPHLQSLLKYANYTKKFIIIEPTPGSTTARTYNTPLSISEALISGKDLSLFKKNITAYEKIDYNAWKWYEPVIKECKNCRTVTTRDIFCNTKECDFIDRESMLGLYCDEAHITPRTSFKLISKIKSAIDN